MVPTYCYDTALYLNGNMFQLFHLHIDFMKFNINIRTKRKIAEKIKGYTNKITNIAAADCPRVANIMLNSSLCITGYLVGRYKNYLICIRSILIKTLKIQENMYTS